MTLSTRFFEPLALTSAKGKGLPDLKQVILPYPYETLPPERIREVARRAVAEVVRALTEASSPSLVRVE
mgnify:CR=1 FL=1